jgi:hypothetical protein
VWLPALSIQDPVAAGMAIEFLDASTVWAWGAVPVMTGFGSLVGGWWWLGLEG